MTAVYADGMPSSMPVFIPHMVHCCVCGTLYLKQRFYLIDCFCGPECYEEWRKQQRDGADYAARNEAAKPHILAILKEADSEMTAKEIKAHAHARERISEATANYALKALVEEGRVRKANTRPALYKALRWHTPPEPSAP